MKFIINNVEIIACKLELFNNPVIDIINQEISAKRERSILQLCCAIKRQNYDPCEYGAPSLNSSPAYMLPAWRLVRRPPWAPAGSPGAVSARTPGAPPAAAR